MVQVSYALVVLLDGVVVILACILNPIAKRRRAREKESMSIEAGDSGVPSPCPGEPVSPMLSVGSEHTVLAGAVGSETREKPGKGAADRPMGTVLRRPSASCGQLG
jgi:hypothetical protein